MKDQAKYAIIKSGGKQYRVVEGDTIDVELLGKNDGESIDFAEVLFMHDGKKAKVSSSDLAHCSVRGEVVGTVPGPKITSVKYKRSHNQYRKFGHKQHYSRVKITAIAGKAKKGAAEHGT